MKRKKRKRTPSLPNHITPVLPDYDKSIDAMNQSLDVDMSGTSDGAGLGEALKPFNLDEIKMRIVTTTIDSLIELGFSEEDAEACTDFDIENVDTNTIYIRVHLDACDMEELDIIEDRLNAIVVQYDPGAKFRFEGDRTTGAYIFRTPILEAKMSEQDKRRLADFIEKTDDTEEIETYMRGLSDKRKTI